MDIGAFGSHSLPSFNAIQQPLKEFQSSFNLSDRRDSTWPTTFRFTVAVWLAVTWAVAVPARAVLGIEAVRCAVPGQ